jgi:tetratricopeptide (TPR) repeat protein
MDDILNQDGTLDIGFTQVNEYGDHYFSKLNYRSFYNASATDLFEHEFSSILFKENSLYAILGTDSGLLPEYIKSKGIPDGTRYLFIEPVSVLSQLNKHKLLEGYDERIGFADEDTWLEKLDAFQLTEYLYLQQVRIHNAFCSQQNVLSIYAELSWYISEKVQQLHYKRCVSIVTEPFILQQLLNVADNINPAIQLANAFKGKTAFILGGGPSLDECIPWLLEHRSYIVVLAVSRIARRLVQVGLEPDFIFSVDPFPASYDVSKELFSLSEKPVFVYSYHCYSELVSQWQGRAVYLENRLPWKSSLNVPNTKGSGPTVINTAVTVAAQFGFSRIFLTGVDFCFTQEGITHAQGSNEFAAGARFNLTGAQVLTYAQEMIPSRLDYLFARDVLEEQIACIKHCQIYNVSLNAAQISNVEYMPLSSIILDQEPVNIEHIFSAHLKNNDVATYLAHARQEMAQGLDQLKKIKRIAEDALHCNNTLYNAAGFIENYKDKEYLNKLEHTLDTKFRKFSKLVKAFGLRNFLKMIKPFDEGIVKAEVLKEQLRIYYESYISGANRLIILLTHVEKILIARTEEQKTDPNWDVIIQQSRDEKIFGRVRTWNRLKSAQKLEPKYKEIFAEFEQKFEQDLKTERTNHAENVKKASDTLVIKNRAEILFKNKKIDLLASMLSALENHSEPEKIESYRFLIEGYIAELKNNKERALNAYQHILEMKDAPLEEALLRIVAIDYTDNPSNLGHMALECLAQINSSYLAMYADSNRIMGNYADALKDYIRYLQIFPEDWITQFKLATLFFEQKIYEGSEIILNMILEHFPEQKNALLLKQKIKEVKEG